MSKTRGFLLGFAILAAGSAIGTAGCNSSADDPRTCHVRGTVTYGGQPIPVGVITFEPDPAEGGSGPQGFAEIVDGRFNTTQSGRGTTGGAQIVVVSGYDGQATEDSSSGKPLFPAWKTTVEVPRSTMTELDFNVTEPSGRQRSTR